MKKIFTEHRPIRVSVYVVSLVIFILILKGCFFPGEPDTKTKPVSVRVAEAQKRTLHPSFEVIGTILANPDRQATITAATPGLVEALLVQEGAHVHKGETLVKLDDRKAQIDLERAQAAYARLTAKPRLEEIAQTQALIAKAKAAQILATNRLKKSLELQKRNPELVPEVQLLDDKRIEEGAQADLDTAQAQMELLIQGPREELRQEAKVEVEATQLQLDFCKVLAPFDGDIVELLARAGMRADVGMPLARIIDTREVLAQARVPSEKLTRIVETMHGNQENSPASIQSLAFPGEIFFAHGGWLNQQTEALTSDVSIKVRVSNPKGLLRVGMSVQIELHEPDVEGIVIPEEAVSIDEEGNRVVTLIKDGVAVPTVIQLSTATELETRAGGWVIVKSGLDQGDLVATENGYALPRDTPVEILSSESTEIENRTPSKE